MATVITSLGRERPGNRQMHIASNGDFWFLSAADNGSLVNVAWRRSTDSGSNWSTVGGSTSFSATQEFCVSTVYDSTNDEIHAIFISGTSTGDNTLRYRRMDCGTATQAADVVIATISSMQKGSVANLWADIALRSTSGDEVVIGFQSELGSVMGVNYERIEAYTAARTVTTSGGFNGPYVADQSNISNRDQINYTHPQLTTASDGASVHFIFSGGNTDFWSRTFLSTNIANSSAEITNSLVGDHAVATRGVMGVLSSVDELITPNCTNTLTCSIYAIDESSSGILSEASSHGFKQSLIDTDNFLVSSSGVTNLPPGRLSPLSITKDGSNLVVTAYTSTGVPQFTFSTDNGATWEEFKVIGTLTTAASSSYDPTTTFESEVGYHTIFDDGTTTGSTRYEFTALAATASGTVQSQDASASGSSTVFRLQQASGTVQSQDASASGAMRVERSASGTVQSQDATVTASAAVRRFISTVGTTEVTSSYIPHPDTIPEIRDRLYRYSDDYTISSFYDNNLFENVVYNDNYLVATSRLGSNVGYDNQIHVYSLPEGRLIFSIIKDFAEFKDKNPNNLDVGNTVTGGLLLSDQTIPIRISSDNKLIVHYGLYAYEYDIDALSDGTDGPLKSFRASEAKSRRFNTERFGNNDFKPGIQIDSDFYYFVNYESDIFLLSRSNTDSDVNVVTDYDYLFENWGTSQGTANSQSNSLGISKRFIFYSDADPSGQTPTNSGALYIFDKTNLGPTGTTFDLSAGPGNGRFLYRLENPNLDSSTATSDYFGRNYSFDSSTNSLTVYASGEDFSLGEAGAIYFYDDILSMDSDGSGVVVNPTVSIVDSAGLNKPGPYLKDSKLWYSSNTSSSFGDLKGYNYSTLNSVAGGIINSTTTPDATFSDSDLKQVSVVLAENNLKSNAERNSKYIIQSGGDWSSTGTDLSRPLIGLYDTNRIAAGGPLDSADVLITRDSAYSFFAYSGYFDRVGDEYGRITAANSLYYATHLLGRRLDSASGPDPVYLFNKNHELVHLFYVTGSTNSAKSVSLSETKIAISTIASGTDRLFVADLSSFNLNGDSSEITSTFTEYSNIANEHDNAGWVKVTDRYLFHGERIAGQPLSVWQWDLNDTTDYLYKFSHPNPYGSLADYFGFGSDQVVDWDSDNQILAISAIFEDVEPNTNTGIIFVYDQTDTTKYNGTKKTIDSADVVLIGPDFDWEPIKSSQYLGSSVKVKDSKVYARVSDRDAYSGSPPGQLIVAWDLNNLQNLTDDSCRTVNSFVWQRNISSREKTGPSFDFSDDYLVAINSSWSGFKTKKISEIRENTGGSSDNTDRWDVTGVPSSYGFEGGRYYNIDSDYGFNIIQNSGGQEELTSSASYDAAVRHMSGGTFLVSGWSSFQTKSYDFYSTTDQPTPDAALASWNTGNLALVTVSENPIQELVSQPATVSGLAQKKKVLFGAAVSGDASTTASGERIITSTGTVVSQASLVNGVSERIVTSSGALQVQDASTIATGERIVTSSGALQSQDASVSSIGEIENTGSGAAVSGDASVTASGLRIVTSTGTVQSQDASTTATIKLTRFASGTPQAQDASTTATGERIVTSSGTVQSQDASVSSIGEIENTGSGDVVSSNASVTASGLRIVTSTGTVQSQTAEASGIGERIVVSSGTPQAQEASTTATIKLTRFASGAVQSQDANADGRLKSSFFGNGTVQSQSATVSSSAERIVTSTGTVLSQTAEASGTGERIAAASGSVQSQTAAASGDTERIVKVSGTVESQSSSTSSDAERIVVSSGTVVSSNASGSGIGERIITSTGTVQSQTALASGVGEIENTGSGTVQSQPATTSGIAERIVKANGVVLSQASSVNGVSERITVSSGTVQSQSASGSGVGERTVKANGAIQSQTALASGVGEIENTGSGAVQSQPSATSGIAERIVKASGTVVSSDASISAVGEIENTASGTPQAQDAAASGVGERTVKANGAVTSQDASVSSIGEIENTGSGTPQAQDATTVGVAERKVKSSGNVVSINSNASGTSRRIVTATGTVQSQESSTTGLINRTTFITASVKSQPATASGTTKIFRATISGTVVSGPATVVSKAERIIKASGAVVSSDASVLRGRIESLGPEVLEVVIEDNQITVIVSDERSIDVDFINKQVINIFNQENTKQISITFKEKDSFKVG